MAIDLENLRLDQNFSQLVGVTTLTTTIPVKKPGKFDFFRVHPDPNYQLQTALLELKEESETYLVDPLLWSELEPFLTKKILFVCINRQQVVFVWPARLPDTNGRLDNWSKSALLAAQMAVDNWVRIKANMNLGAYEISQPVAVFPEPVWPDMELDKLLNIAFDGRYIDSIDHPVVKKLRGEI